MRYAIRSLVAASIAARVRELSPSEQRRVQEGAPGVDIDGLAGKWVLQWVPMESHMELCDSIRAVLGSARNVEYWNRSTQAVTTDGFFADLVQTATRIYGMTPRGYFKIFPKAYGYATRDLGRIRVLEITESRATIELRGFPAEAFSFPCYIEGMHGCLLAAYHAVGTKGQVAVASSNSRTGTVRYDCTW